MTKPKTNFAEMSPEARASYFGRKVYLEFGPLAQFEKQMRTLELAHGSALNGKVSLFYGVDGAGKTVACEHYMRGYAKAKSGRYSATDERFGEADSIHDALWVSVTDGNREVRPVVKVDIAPRVSFNGLLGDAFRGMTGGPPPQGCRHTELLRTIRQQLFMQRTKILVFDNAHHCVERAINDGKANAGDIFAHIAEKCGVEIVLLGTSVARSLFENSKYLKPMRRFEIEVREIPPPLNGSMEFVDLLRKYEGWMPFVGNSDLTSDAALTRLYAYCKGNIGTLATFLNTVVVYGLVEGFSHVDLRLIEIAYDELNGHPAANPFEIDRNTKVRA